MTFGSQIEQTEAKTIFDYCLDHGINFFDTANVYNQGESERILGRCMKGQRDKIVLASKVRGRMDAGYEGLSRGVIVRAIEESLERLGTDHLDLYYLHHPDPAIPIEESLEAMEQLVKAGKIRFPAMSNYAAWQVTEAQWIASAKGHTPATVTQPMYNLLARGLEQEYLPMCERLGIFTCIFNPLAGGLLTGKQRNERPLENTRFALNPMYVDRYWYPAQFEAVAELSSAAQAHGRSLLSVALNWIYRHTKADCIIMGASKLEQLQQNVAALDDGPLPQELLTTCDAVWAKLRGITPKYNR